MILQFRGEWVNFGQLGEMARLFYESDLYPQITSRKQAMDKIIEGVILGIESVEAMNGQPITKGRMALNALVMAACIRGSERYEYRVDRCNGEQCTLSFFQDGGEIGSSTYTYDDAVADGSLGSSRSGNDPTLWLLSCAMGSGARQYCAGIFSRPVASPDQLHADLEEAIVEWEDGLTDLWLPKRNGTNTTFAETEGSANLG